METLDSNKQPIHRNERSPVIRRLTDRDAFWAALLLVCLFLLSYRFLGLWFMHDDAACIYGSTRSISELLFDKDVYRSVNKMFYTPLLPISVKPDSSLFGLNPLPYHGLNLLAVFCTGLMGYAACRIYLPRSASWMATFLFVLSYPAVTNVGYLTLRHYAWGTFFSLLALVLFKKGEEGHRLRLFLASYGAYLVALLFKESFAAFPGIILLLAQGTWRKKTLKALPYLLVFGGYFALRFHMIGGLGGYVGIYVAPTIQGFLSNGFAQMDLFSRGTWGLGAVYTMPFFLMLLALNGRVGATLTGVFLLLIAPFWFLKVPGEGDSFQLFYLPPRFLLPFFLLSLLPGFAIAKARTARAGGLAYATAAVLLLLQLSNAQNAYTYIEAATEEARVLVSEALRRNEQGRDILLASRDAIFYSYYYESYLRLNGVEDMGTAMSLTPGARTLRLLEDVDLGRVDDLYWEDRWVDPRDASIPFTGLEIDPAIPKAEAIIDFDNGTASLRITDRRRGSFYGVLKTLLSRRNTVYLFLPLPTDLSLRVGLSRGMDTGYLHYCKAGRCSPPLVVGGERRGRDPAPES
jgi:hypothetical protein